MSAITEYLADLRRNHATGEAREHAYRPALRDLLQALRTGVTAVNEPKHTAAGAVDFIVKRGEEPIGWLEAKDIGADLGKVAKSEQVASYLGAYPNLILTDYLEFRLYLGGKLVEQASLGLVSDGKIVSTGDKQQAVEKLLTTFLAQEVYRAGKPEDLAKRMAYFARMAVNAIVGTLKQEGERGQLHSQMAAFRETLLPDLTEEQFADMYAQTVAYGLFAAKCHHPQGDDFNRWTASKYLPPTNPFLQRLFHEITGPDLDEAVVWVVDELVSLLRNTDMSAIVEAFARHQQGREDPVVHFYETFLKEYNPKERKLRGVYYTPEPVVSYIVRSVDYLLKTEFGKPLGLADPEVFILDPACGTGTFLYFVIEHIHRTITAQQGAGAWPGYVREHLLQRVFGFELLMAPYTIAHLKLAQLLKEQGYDFPDETRLGVYLTNTLEEARLKSETLVQRYISEEAAAASDVKREKPIMVVLGNPPYSVSSQNKGEWISRLVRDYYFVDGAPLGERNPKSLQDDYVKFMRFAQWRIATTGHGVSAFITNSGFVDNPTFRGMRQSLLSTYGKMWLLNLHGHLKKHECAPAGVDDKNVFDIQQGVAISLLLAKAEGNDCRVEYADLWGSQEQKHDVLYERDVSGTAWSTLSPIGPHYFLVPRDTAEEDEYNQGASLESAFVVSSRCLTTHRDDLVIDFDKRALQERLSVVANPAIADHDVAERYGLHDTGTWRIADARRALASVGDNDGCIVPCYYRPYDTRWLLYDDALLDRPRRAVMQHMLHGNLGLLSTRQVTGLDFCHCAVTESVAEFKCVSHDRNSSIFPLYLYPEGGSLEAGAGRRPNLNPKFIADLEGRLGWRFIPDGEGDLQGTFGPEDVFHYLYAVLHSPTYRTRYAEFLKIDFPRLPLTSDRDLFRELCGLGKELVALHLLKSPLLADSPARFEGVGTATVEGVRYDESNARVYINQTQYFSGIGKALYEFQVGGYQVMNKWLKDRKGRHLTYDDLTHYMRVAAALTHTMRLMAEIDEVITVHGGFPDAFAPAPPSGPDAPDDGK
jgi:predicted helicase